jgi:transglutaminase-like putative cysteine protease
MQNFTINGSNYPIEDMMAESLLYFKNNFTYTYRNGTNATTSATFILLNGHSSADQSDYSASSNTISACS